MNQRYVFESPHKISAKDEVRKVSNNFDDQQRRGGYLLVGA
jgi:hypothetical protein